ncbi:MAG: RNA methyltransferase [Patescibacteria group bacterium]
MFCLVLDNLRSALNAGAIFRTADAVGVERIYLCGITPRPSQSGRAGKDLAKTALGAEKHLAWEYKKRAGDAINQLKKQRFKIIALEQDKKAVDVFKFRLGKKQKIALVLGNEVRGISKNILKKCDKIIYIPMFGKKESLNVAVAFGIASYCLKFRK